MTFIRTHQVRSMLAALLSTTAWGLAYAGTGDGIVRSDPQLQQIKYEAVSFEADLQKVDLNLRFPRADRVTIDTSVDAAGLQLQNFEVSIDGAPPVREIYSHVEAIAFRTGGLQHVLDTSAAPGTHRLHVSFSAIPNSGSPLQPTVSGNFDQSFEKTAGQALTLELALVRDDGRSAPALRCRSWTDSQEAEGEVRGRESTYLSAAHHYLFAAAADQGIAGISSTTSALMPLAAALLEFGSREAAESLLGRLAQAGDQGPSFMEAQLRLATYDYRSGDLDAAAARLNRFKAQAAENQRWPWNDLYIQTLLARGKYRDAIPLLRSADSDSDTSTAYIHYNLAIALLNDGHASKGRSLLDDIGETAAITEEQRSLRDKANVVLGYDYLRRKEGSKAAPMFERVRLDGPYASRALLGLGWARYSQHGHMPNEHWGADKRGKSPDDVPTDAEVELPNFSGERLADIQRALVPWMQLRSRDPLDPAVQESLLAIPYALQKAGDAQQAGKFYAEAIISLQKTADSLDQAENEVRRSLLFDDMIQASTLDDSGWHWQLNAMPATRSSWLLRPLIAEDSFQIALRDYRDARFLQTMVESWRKRLATLSTAAGEPAPLGTLSPRLDDLSARIANATGSSRERLIALALKELQAQKKMTQTYQLQARIALSRVYDSPTAEDAR